MSKTKSQILVIFGASGDLTTRKLIPAIFNLYKGNFLSKDFLVLGVSRSNLTNQEFRNRMVYESEFLKDRIKDEPEDFIKKFADKLYYTDLGEDYISSYEPLKAKLKELGDAHGIDPNYMFYLSTPPSLYEPISKNLCKFGLTNQQDGFRRVIIEKPFGYSLASAKELNKNLLSYFEENQIYRIDHYLGKETIQNLLVTRFSNSIFEPLWNRNFISHIEITNAEQGGVGSRGGYYEGSGALRDMFQNHLMQIIALVTMEPPIEIEANAIRDEKVKALKSLRPWTPETIRTDTVRGQYISSKIKGEQVKGYREEKGVDKESKTETFAALKFYIDNWRWKNVPFYVRTAKRMPTKVTEVVIHFKPTPHRLFDTDEQDNQLVIRIQPSEGVLLKFSMKIPGQGFKVKDVGMDFHYSDLTDAYVPEAYERLLLDAMQGDATLYSRGDEAEAAWAFVDPIINAWRDDESIKMYGYPAGSWGPDQAEELIEGNITWRFPCKSLSIDDCCEL